MDPRKLPVPMESVLTRAEYVMVNMIVVIGPMRFAAQGQVSFFEKFEFMIRKIFFLKKDGCEPNQFQCDNGKCILKTWMCDSDDDCLDGSDERNCGTNEWNCSSGNQAIPKSFHCDGEVDCTDLSDEIGCSE